MFSKLDVQIFELAKALAKTSLLYMVKSIIANVNIENAEIDILILKKAIGLDFGRISKKLILKLAT